MENIFLYPAKKEWERLIARPAIEAKELSAVVGSVLHEVRTRGDAALYEYSLKFDGVKPDSLLVPQGEIDSALKSIPTKLKQSIETARKTITTFHQSHFEPVRRIETAKGVQCWRRSLPIEKVGLYIPGGRAPLFSTVLMLAIPASVAGCSEIILCTPPNKEGQINPTILYAAQQAGVKKIFRVGGAQAIAAMAFGTESIPRVYKIFGPGNQYVTAAKTMVAAQAAVAIDMPAGPTEVLVIADEFCNPRYVAADLLSQAEHGPDSQVILVTTSEKILPQIQSELDLQLKVAARREIMQEALSHSRIVVLKTLEEAIHFSNLYAPEHLVLAVKDPQSLADKVISAGSVFLGNFAAESFGDYVAGVNHTLPTCGAAHAYSGVSLDSFVKKITFQTLDSVGVNSIGFAAEEMAKAEGLEAHAQAVAVRLADLTQNFSATFSLSRLVRENIKKLTPYVCARHEFDGNGILLDANENSIGSVSEETINRYPDPYQRTVKEKLAKIKGVASDQILLANGSDEAIDLLYRAFCNPSLDNVIIMPPTYGMYEVCAAINDVYLKKVNLDHNFQIDTEGVLKEVTPLTKLIFICSPNNPTGNTLNPGAINKILSDFDGIVVLDEAYIDFSKEKSALTLLDTHPNLVVLQTFSKAWGMAGARLGMLFASKEIVELLNTIKPPYNINELTIKAALSALASLPKKEAMQEVLLKEREKLLKQLTTLKCVEKVYPSDANFLLVKFDDAKECYQFLREKGVIVRDRSDTTSCENCLRITVGTPQENTVLIDACTEYNKTRK
jgi:histidinol-phosphate aminotransferase